METNLNSILGDSINKDLNDFFSNSNFKLSYVSNNEQDTTLLAKHFAKFLKKDDIVVLNGDLGVGKTLFVSGLADFFEISNQVSSPTFTIVNEYNIHNEIISKNCNTNNIFHFDVYRLNDSTDFLNSVGNEYFTNGICIIEWGNIIEDILPSNTIFIDISKSEDNENLRYITLTKGGQK